MFKQLVKTYEHLLGDFRQKIKEKSIADQINEDLESNSGWKIHLLTYFQDGKYCTVVYDIEYKKVIEPQQQDNISDRVYDTHLLDKISYTSQKTTNPCENCWFYKKLQKEGIYVGDSPCQWCEHYPFKITCDTGTLGTFGTVSGDTKGGN